MRSDPTDFAFWQVAVVWPDLDPVVRVFRDEREARDAFGRLMLTAHGRGNFFLAFFDGYTMTIVESSGIPSLVS